VYLQNVKEESLLLIDTLLIDIILLVDITL